MGVSEAIWMVFLTAEIVALMACVINYDPTFHHRSPNHNVYRIYIVSLLAMILTVWVFMIFAVYKFVVPEIAIMTYLLFCLPIWLTLAVSFFELQKVHSDK